MRKSALFEADVERLQEFMAAFIAYADYEPNETARSDERVGRTLYTDVIAKAGASAGAAAEAFARHGRSESTAMADWRNARGGSKWSANRRLVVADIAHALGAAVQAREAAKTEERTLAGRVASVIRWPRDLAESVGGSSRQQTAARTIGYAGQIAIPVIAGYMLWLLTN
jgi:hypothetical protein